MTIKLLTIGDLHFSGKGPAAYIGDYKQDLLNILAECADLARGHSCAAVLLPGDITHSHIMSLPVLHELIEALKKFPCPVLTVAGNHDRETSNLEDLKAAPYGVLEATWCICDVFNQPWISDDSFTGYQVKITGHPYDEETDKNNSQYCIKEVEEDIIYIHFTHGLLLPDHPWWVKEKDKSESIKNIRYTTFDQLRQVPKERRPHILINGHWHTGHDPYWLDEKTLILNFGAVTRLTRSLDDINRTLQVGLITIESPERYYAEPIVLKSQRPGHLCLNREELARELERDKRKDQMSQYLSLLGTKRETRTRDAREIIKLAAKELSAGGMDLPGNIAERCIARVNAVAGRMEAAEK